ncbi:MAG: hypothetical protein DHS20C05_25010 [Hyphococcus sp.]|nr:MAG: hypothetical protein DHS20C05_25010 [Marinicaulis sp.]
MDNNLDTLWRRAVLWPDNAVSVLSAARASRRTDAEIGDLRKRNLHGAYFGEKLTNSNEQKPIAVAALDALAPLSDEQAVRSAYAAIRDVLISPYGSMECWDAVKPALSAWDKERACASFLEFVILESPDPIAVHNAMLFLSYTGKALGAAEIEILGCGTNHLIADRACNLAMQSTLPVDERERLAFECARHGTQFAESEILKNVRPESDRKIKDWLLQQLFADMQRGFVYIIDDYVDYILDYIESGDLLSALKDAAPPDWLIDGALKLFGDHLCRGIDRGVIWLEPGDDAYALECLFRLVEHATSRALSPNSLRHLSQIYYNAFSHAHEETLAGEKETPDQVWLKGKDEDLAAAASILAALQTPDNKEKIDIALESTDSKDFADAIDIVENVSADDYFSILFNAVEKGPYPVRLNELRRSVKTVEQARDVIAWATKWCNVNENGYFYYPGRGYGRVLQEIIPLAGDYPGLGGPLVLAGLDYRSPAKDEAVQALLVWPVYLWPPQAGDRLRLALKHNVSTHEALREALQKLPPKE